MPVKDFSGHRSRLGCGEPLDLDGHSNLCFVQVEHFSSTLKFSLKPYGKEASYNGLLRQMACVHLSWVALMNYGRRIYMK